MRTYKRIRTSGERIYASLARRAERGLWQRRYWEPVVRDEDHLSACEQEN